MAALPDAPIINRFIINAWADTKFVQAVKKTGREKADYRRPQRGCVPDVPGNRGGAVMDASSTVNQHAAMAAMFCMSQAGANRIGATPFKLAATQPVCLDL